MPFTPGGTYMIEWPGVRLPSHSSFPNDPKVGFTNLNWLQTFPVYLVMMAVFLL